MSDILSTFASKTTMVRYKVTLTGEERTELEDILKKGRHTSLKFRNACVLLNCDESAEGKK